MCERETVSKEEISRTLKSIGGSQFDLYTGNLNEAGISDQITAKLKNNKIFSKTRYFEWLDTADKGFHNISIDDGSVWTMLKGNFDDYYIHIHPARYSPNTIRVKANPWKSAIASLIYCKMNINKACIKSVINRSREVFAGLGPVHEKFDHTIIDLIGIIAGRYNDFKTIS